MKRVIYSLYVDVPAKEHFGNSKIKSDTIEKASLTVNAFKKHYDKLIETKNTYAEYCEADFMMFEYDLRYQKFEKKLLKVCPELTGYEVVNFYKIHVLEELSKDYDEILYLDFDVIPFTDESFFDVWDLSRGICVYSNNDHVVNNVNVSHSIRSPSAKFFNCQAMLIEKGLSSKNDVINTGIIGARKEDIQKLDFFGKFKDTINLMTELRKDTSGLYPQNIIDMFRYDNETIFSYKREVNKVTIQWLDDKWHYFLDNQKFIPKDTKLVHCICKDFDLVWRNHA
tara:strand:+ start:11 stop:859 length:849 start_codon:yes stop_codon:yes gene_type:complete